VPARSEQNTLDQLLGIHRAVGTQRHKTIGGAHLAGGNISDVVSQHIEPPDLDGPLQLHQPPGQQRLGFVAGLARLVQSLGRGDRAGSLHVDQTWQGQGIKKQSDDHLRIDPPGNIGNSR